MKATAEIIDLETQRLPKSDGNGGGFDHFTTMKPGTVFASIGNSVYGSECQEFMLLSRSGVTVLLRDPDGKLERHIGQKFWSINTLVQILHIPEEEGKENGKGADV